MAEDRPHLTLITPPVVDLELFPDRLARVMDRTPVAALRLALAGRDEGDLGRIADTLRAVAHERDVAVVIDTHLGIAERHGLDGVHLLDSARSVRAARKALGADAIVGAYCGISRDAGLSAGEAGADYVTFGPAGDDPLANGRRADRDLFAWWSEMVEVPVVAEGALTEAVVADLAPVTDFFAVGPEIWAADDPAEALARLVKAMG